jgi:hypothetical protein
MLGRRIASSVARLGSARRRALYLILGLIFVAAVVVPLFASRRARIEQPVAFNHLKHTQELGLDCEFCHTYVRKGAHAGLPDAQTCSLCHQALEGTTAEAARVRELLAEGDPLQFNKLFRLPPHVFFTHRRHVAIAGLECENCHGGIADTERPPERPLVKVKMSFCLECHRERGQSVDCTACHR